MSYRTPPSNRRGVDTGQKNTERSGYNVGESCRRERGGRHSSPAPPPARSPDSSVEPIVKQIDLIADRPERFQPASEGAGGQSRLEREVQTFGGEFFQLVQHDPAGPN